MAITEHCERSALAQKNLADQVCCTFWDPPNQAEPDHICRLDILRKAA